jgi:protein FrlC
MKLSVSTAVYYRYSLVESIKRIAELGYNAVEIWGGRPHAFPDDMTDSKINEIKKSIREYDLEISGLIPAQFRYPTNLGIEDEKIREASISYINHSINIADRLGIKYVSVCPGFTLFGKSRGLGSDLLKNSLYKILEHAAKFNNIEILIEPAHKLETNIIIFIEDSLKLLEEINKPSLGIVLDTGHINVNKELFSDAVRLLGDHIKHIHIDDNHGYNDDHLIPGEGNINFEKVILDLKKINYKGFLTVELGFGYTIDPDKAVYQSLKYLNKIGIK